MSANEFHLIHSLHSAHDAFRRATIKKVTEYPLEGSCVVKVDIVDDQLIVVDSDSLVTKFEQNGKVIGQDDTEELQCAICNSLSKVVAINKCRDGYEAWMIECGCDARSAKGDPLDIQSLAMVKDGKVVGVLDRNVASFNSIKCQMSSSFFVVANKETLIYRESTTKKLVQVKWSDIENRDFNAWEYLKVPDQVKEEPVASFCLNSIGRYTVLWENGQFIVSDEKQIISEPLLENQKVWNLVKQAIGNQLLFSSTGAIPDSAAVGQNLLLYNKSTKKYSRASIPTDPSSTYSTSLQALVPAFTGRHNRVYVAVSLSGTIHVVQCTDKSVSVLLADYTVAGPRDWCLSVACVGSKGNCIDVYVSTAYHNALVKLKLTLM